MSRAVLLAELVGLAIVDQAIKLWVDAILRPVGTLPILDGVVQLTYVQNYGAGFGILQGMRWPLVLVSTAVIAAFIYFVVGEKLPNSLTLRIGTVLIAGGGLGNLIDRLRLGYVTDYIDVSPWFSFPVFNFADSCVSVGAALLVIYILFFDKSDVKEETEK